MITRLTELTVDSFRAFGGKETIDLNADVVLIHGSNGAGKSSLLSAIEFAVAGSVSDYARFGKDYPRCLRHVRSQAASCEVKFLNGGASVHAVGSAVSQSDGVSRRGRISEEDARFFVERSYLSQVKLGRLLDSYQAVEKGEREPPIIQFVKRLLQLEGIEHLTASLHDIEDLRRSRSAFPEIAELEHREAALQIRRSALAAQMLQSTTAIAESTTFVYNALGEIGIDASIADLASTAAVKALGSQVRLSAEAEELGRVESTQRNLLKLKEYRIVLRDVDAVSPRPLAELLSAKSRFEGELTQLERTLGGILSLAEAEIRRSHIVTNVNWGETLLDRWAYVGSVLSDIGRQSSARRRRRDDYTNEITKCTKEESELLRTLEVCVQRIASLTIDSPQWVEILALVEQLIDGDECPVCQRDFRETSPVGLKEFVHRRATELREKLRQLQAAEDERQSAKNSLDLVRRQLTSLNDLLQKETSPEVLAGEVRVDDVVKQMNAQQEQLDRYSSVQASLREVDSDIALARARSQRLKAGEEVLALMAKEVGGGTSLAGRTPEDAAAVELRSEELLSRLHRQKVGRESAIRALLAHENLLKAKDALDGKWQELNAETESVQSVRSRIDDVVSKSKSVLKAAINAKREVVDRVFDETLNRLWRNIFDRIVPNEIFHPRLDSPVSKRDSFRVTMQAVASGVDPFDNIGAVLSLGNQNTTAVALFLSLNLLVGQTGGVLVLDDPVQCMDDVHVSQMAILLRELVSHASKQIIVAVHERELFEYLEFELTPANTNTSLVTVSLSRDEGGESSTALTRRVPPRSPAPAFASALNIAQSD